MAARRSDPRGAHPGRVAFQLAQVGGLGAIKFAARIKALDLAPAQVGLLRAVAQEPGRSQRALAKQLGTLPSRLVIIIDQLVEAGLLERRVGERDRRVSELHLTPAGTKMMERIGELAQAHGEDLLAPLDSEERATLARLLGRLAEHHDLTPGVHPGYRSLGQNRPPEKRSTELS